ncbi:MAG: holo-[acyl-carrier-protein] synthase [Chitinivibrionales bacterium]|nr:holo-[acyl-carrier-protein] synthase [Chitinivibrionales bacterium]MBD3395045.1 holo-[acyl-carrier-protein] synthase [Chitinivibrionales bacterium]
MVTGTGIDIVDIQRIERLIGRYGDHFLNKVFTAAEIKYCRSRARPGPHFAGRWAAKEAFYKALPASCQARATWRAIEIVPVPETGGRPRIAVVSESLGRELASAGIASFHVSISHEKSVCVAMVIAA